MAKHSEFGFRIKELIDNEGENIHAFALKCGVDYRMMHRYVTKGEQPSSIILKKVVEATNVNAEWLLTGKGSMYRDKPTPYKSAEDVRREVLYASDFDDLPEGLKNLVYNEERFNALHVREDEIWYLKSPEVASMVGATGGTASEDAFVFMLERLRSGDINFMKLDKAEEALVNLYRDLDEEGKIAAEKYLTFLSTEAKRKKRSNPDSINKLNERF